MNTTNYLIIFLATFSNSEITFSSISNVDWSLVDSFPQVSAVNFSKELTPVCIRSLFLQITKSCQRSIRWDWYVIMFQLHFFSFHFRSPIVLLKTKLIITGDCSFSMISLVVGLFGTWRFLSILLLIIYSGLFILKMP